MSIVGGSVCHVDARGSDHMCGGGSRMSVGSTASETEVSWLNDAIRSSIKYSTCTKRRIVAILTTVSGKSFVGWNGPPKTFEGYCDPCPRINSMSGEDMHLCPAVHAEMSAVLTASHSQDIRGSTLTLSCGLPCKDCMKELIFMGVARIRSPYPIEIFARRDGFKDDVGTYNFGLSFRMMLTAGIIYEHDPRIVKGVDLDE